VREVDELVAECGDHGVSHSEIVEGILTAFVQSETNHVERVREISIRTRKGTLKQDLKFVRSVYVSLREEPIIIVIKQTVVCEEFYDTLAIWV
jgi:hypothetical protein